MKENYLQARQAPAILTVQTALHKTFIDVTMGERASSAPWFSPE
jgi:hypothetical protein